MSRRKEGRKETKSTCRLALLRMLVKTALKSDIRAWAYTRFRVSGTQTCARSAAFSFGSEWRDQHRDGARDGGELLGVAEIVVRIGRDGGTFVLLYLPWAERHSISQPCFFAIERLLVNWWPIFSSWVMGLQADLYLFILAISPAAVIFNLCQTTSLDQIAVFGNFKSPIVHQFVKGTRV